MILRITMIQLLLFCLDGLIQCLSLYIYTHWDLTHIFRGESSNGDNPFREWYAKLGEIRSLTECPVLLITATANAAARKCMRKKFCMVNYIEIIDNPDRENVKLFVRKVKSSVPLGKTFSFLITSVKKEKEKCPRYIILCTSIKTCGELFPCSEWS